MESTTSDIRGRELLRVGTLKTKSSIFSTPIVRLAKDSLGRQVIRTKNFLRISLYRLKPLAPPKTKQYRFTSKGSELVPDVVDGVVTFREVIQRKKREEEKHDEQKSKKGKKEIVPHTKEQAIRREGD